MCLHEHHLANLKKLNYVPVGLGKNNFSSEWLRDNKEINISEKNSYYGEYTFYYWFWKNILNILKEIPKEWDDTNIILGEEIFVDNWKLSKILKHGGKYFLKNPKYFLKKNRNIKLHFDIFHGPNILDRAIEVLNHDDRIDFKDFVNNEKSFNRENLFFCRSKQTINDYFTSVFNWLLECEKLFGFDLKGYSQTRLYAFLAERYISFWFKKYTKFKTWPIFFYDTNKNKIVL